MAEGMQESMDQTMETEVKEMVESISELEKAPDLMTWEEDDDSVFMYFAENETVVARYDKFLGLNNDSNGQALSSYIINMKHYKTKMPDIVHHINYFETFYDKKHELFISMMSIKYIVDTTPNLTQKAFRTLVLSRIITPSFVTKVKLMASDLYTLDIDTDKEGKYKNTPKITNEQARQLVALSFCFRMIIPLCVHFSNKNASFIAKKTYIGCFDKLFSKIFRVFEENDVHVYTDLCRLIASRIDKGYNFNKGTWTQKKQLHGLTKDIFTEEVIHEVIIVKSLHKLSYTRSVVSFIDGIIFGYNKNFKSENFPFKPFEIDAESSSSDDDDYLSHAESLEMATYQVDESNMLINSVNTRQVLKKINERFNIPVSDEELEFYNKKCKWNTISEFFLHSFYSPIFHDSYAIYNIPRKDTIRLLIILKKYLQLKGLSILPQICTARPKGRFKDNMIKNNKFAEMCNTDCWDEIIDTKFRYVTELGQKEDPRFKILSTIINSTFELVDPDERIDGLIFDEIRMEVAIHEFGLFLSII